MMTTSKIGWKKALAAVALFLAFSAFSNTALAAKPCSVNCLSVYSNQLTDLGTYINGTVKLIDETGSGGGARSAVVHAVWTRPDGSTMDQYDVIGTRLRAEFRLTTGGVPGTYTLTVAGVSKAGYTFDPSNKDSTSITVGGNGNQVPVAVANADVLSGSAPLYVTFSSAGSVDPDGSIAGYFWNFGDGETSIDADPVHTYLNIGNFTATLTVSDNLGATASSSVSISVMDSNAGCTNNCMTVDQVSLSFKKKKGSINGSVKIDDENGSAVKNAGIHVEWVMPDGTTRDDYAETDRRGIARFSHSAGDSGIYTLRVVEVVNDGYTFDADGSNVLEGMINISL